jgi:hypothetical protein
MRTFFGILVMVFGVSVLALAAGKDDDIKIQSGYAVITPASGAGTNMVAFETFGLHGRGSDGGTLQAGVLPAGLTTNAVLFVETSGRLSKNLGVAIVNPNNSDLSVSMTLRKDDGTQIASGTLNVPARRQVSKFVTELFPAQTPIPKELVGTLSLTSTGTTLLPFGAIGLRFRGANFSTIPVTSLSTPTSGLPVIVTNVGGEGAILLPQFATGGGWATEIVVANNGTSSITVRVDLFNPDGSPLTATLNGQTGSSFTNLVVPAHGVLALEPASQGDDD